MAREGCAFVFENDSRISGQIADSLKASRLPGGLGLGARPRAPEMGAMLSAGVFASGIEAEWRRGVSGSVHESQTTALRRAKMNCPENASSRHSYEIASTMFQAKSSKQARMPNTENGTVPPRRVEYAKRRPRGDGTHAIRAGGSDRSLRA